MILLAEGGSTKCDWVLLDKDGEVVFKTETPGLNPAVLTREEIIRRISENPVLTKNADKIEKVEFYGAGCRTEKPRQMLKGMLEEIFTSSSAWVFEDMIAAVYAVTSSPGIVCILGTGSNSCYFDGKEIHIPIPSLGYSIMDEASGFYFGRELIRDYFYKRMPESLADLMEKTYDLNPDEIKHHLYQKPHPNAYIGKFAEVLFNPELNKKTEENFYVYQLIKKGIQLFIDCRILTFDNANQVPIHFIGSIAYFSKDVVEECLEENGLKAGKFVRKPMDGLVDYYKRKLWLYRK